MWHKSLSGNLRNDDDDDDFIPLDLKKNVIFASIVQ